MSEQARTSMLSIPDMWDPARLVRFLITTNIVMYLTSLAIAPSTIILYTNSMTILSPSIPVMYKLGASGLLPILAQDRWWTLVTANYLHGGLPHLVFNVMALRSVGKITIDIYGPSRFFIIYCLGGVFSMLASLLALIPLTLGASGAVCALIGCMSYDDWRANKDNLKMRIASVGVWVVFIALIGMFLPAVNNWAHGVGFASGFFLGFCLWPRTTIKENKLIRGIAIAMMVTTIASLIYGLMFASG